MPKAAKKKSAAKPAETKAISLSLKSRVVEAWEAGLRDPTKIAQELSARERSVRWYLSSLGLKAEKAAEEKHGK